MRGKYHEGLSWKRIKELRARLERSTREHLQRRRGAGICGSERRGRDHHARQNDRWVCPCGSPTVGSHRCAGSPGSMAAYYGRSAPSPGCSLSRTWSASSIPPHFSDRNIQLKTLAVRSRRFSQPGTEKKPKTEWQSRRTQTQELTKRHLSAPRSGADTHWGG